MDAIACESQFVDHAAPVWRALEPEIRGRFLVDAPLVDRAVSRGLEPEILDATAIRMSSAPPLAGHASGPLAFVTSVGDTKVGRRLGYRRFAFMEHGAGQAYLGDGGIPHPSYAGGLDREDTELFLVPNEYSADLWRRRYGARVEVVGSVRLDDLPGRTFDPDPRPVIAISFHWPAFVAPEAGTALGHYLGILPELARRFRVIGHGHPKGDWPRRMERLYRRAGIEFVPDFDDVCRRADIYVCDNSSTLFEFASTGRPVVVLNSPAFRRRIQHGLRFWDAADVGVQVDDPGHLVEGIELAVEDGTEQRANRERALDIVYAFRSGAAARAAAVIADHVRSAVAA